MSDIITADPALHTRRFVKRPIEIEAIQLTWANWNAVCAFVGDNINPEYPGWSIPADEASDTCGEPGPEYIAMTVVTAHGDRTIVRHGDWIVPDSKPDTFYPIKPDVLATTYDEVTPGQALGRASIEAHQRKLREESAELHAHIDQQVAEALPQIPGQLSLFE